MGNGFYNDFVGICHARVLEFTGTMKFLNLTKPDIQE